MIEVGKNNFINSNKFWLFMVAYYVSFFIFSLLVLSIDYSIIPENISNSAPYFLFNDKFEPKYVVSNYYTVSIVVLMIFNIICFGKFPYLREFNIYSIKILLILAGLLVLWLFGIIGFFFNTRYFGEVPTAFIHATWLPAANIIGLIFIIENGRKLKLGH